MIEQDLHALQCLHFYALVPLRFSTICLSLGKESSLGNELFTIPKQIYLCKYVVVLGFLSASHQRKGFVAYLSDPT